MSAVEYSIGVVAKKLNLPVHTIRFWTETFKHIETIRRNGRRYYDDKAVEELRKVKELSHKNGMKIEGIQQMVRYNKISLEKLESINKNELCIDLEKAINIIDKIIVELS